MRQFVARQAQAEARLAQAQEAVLIAGDPHINIVPEPAMPAYLLPEPDEPLYNREEAHAQLATPAELAAAARNAAEEFDRVREAGQEYIRRQQAEGYNKFDWDKYA